MFYDKTARLELWNCDKNNQSWTAQSDKDNCREVPKYDTQFISLDSEKQRWY